MMQLRFMRQKRIGTVFDENISLVPLACIQYNRGRNPLAPRAVFFQPRDGQCTERHRAFDPRSPLEV